MGLLIVGAGLAGLASAVRTKQLYPDTDVTVMEKQKSESNTQISGLRIREKKVERLMAIGNGGELRDEMVQFSKIGLTELGYWKSILPYEESENWFGPQFFNGIGTKMLINLRDLARESGVKFIEGEIQKLINDNGRISGVLTGGEILSAREIILANGTVSGSLFISTNRAITTAAHTLAYGAGLPLVDGTINMFHPFGKCDKDGNPKLGCYETDKLAGVDVFFADGRKSEDVTDLLLNHDAHNHFPEISREFVDNGSVVRLVFPNGVESYARVSHHYSHMGIKTDDGVRVSGTENLMAVGDASNLGFWTNHKQRFPGFALLKCFVDASLIAGRVGEMSVSSRMSPVETKKSYGREGDEDGEMPDALRHLNTKMLFEINFGKESTRNEAASSWVAESSRAARESKNVLVRMSRDLAIVHDFKLKHPECREPIPIIRGIYPMDAELTRQKRFL